MKVLKIIGLVNGHKTKLDGEYLKYYNPNDHDGLGEFQSTPDIEEAQTFKTMIEALELWKEQSKKIPFRPDGKPNRPFTAFSVIVVTKEDMN